MGEYKVISAFVYHPYDYPGCNPLNLTDRSALDRFFKASELRHRKTGVSGYSIVTQVKRNFSVDFKQLD